MFFRFTEVNSGGVCSRYFRKRYWLICFPCGPEWPNSNTHYRWTCDVPVEIMFHGKTAWFSSSVPSKRVRLWKQHDGKEVSIEKAQFVFSDECQVADTRKLYDSSAYINEHLAIFHSAYISECVRKEDTTKVVLGDYFLPPLEVMEVIRGQTKLAWENHSADHLEDSDEESVSEARVTGPTHSNTRKTNTSIGDVQKNTADTSPPKANSRQHQNTEVIRGQTKLAWENHSADHLEDSDEESVSEARVTGGQRGNTSQATDKAISDNSTQRRSPRQSSKKSTSTTVDNADEANVVHIDNLPKVTGALEPFYPGQNGCVVFMKS